MEEKQGRRNKKDRETGRGTINETFRNPTKFHKESFLSFLVFFYFGKARRLRSLPWEIARWKDATSPPPSNTPLTPSPRQSASQLTEEGSDVLLHSGVSPRLQKALLDSNLIASRDTSEARLRHIIKIIILKPSNQGVSEHTRYEAIGMWHSISLWSELCHILMS